MKLEIDASNYIYDTQGCRMKRIPYICPEVCSRAHQFRDRNTSHKAFSPLRGAYKFGRDVG